MVQVGTDHPDVGSTDFLHFEFRVLAVMKGAIYIWMSSSELHTLHQAFTDAGGY
jgi:hypothetical protein